MASKQHGVGFPVDRPWRIQFAHGRCNSPAEILTDPSVDPWLRIGDPEHRRWPTPRDRAAETLFYLDLLAMLGGASMDCYVGGFSAAPHRVGVKQDLELAFALGLLGSPEEWDGVPNQLELFLAAEVLGAREHLVFGLLGRNSEGPEVLPPPPGNGFFLPSDRPLTEVPPEWRPGSGSKESEGLVVADQGVGANKSWTWQILAGPLQSPVLRVYANPLAWKGMTTPARVRDLSVEHWPAADAATWPSPGENPFAEPQEPPKPVPEPGDELDARVEKLEGGLAALKGRVSEETELRNALSDKLLAEPGGRIPGLARLFEQRIEKLTRRVEALEVEGGGGAPPRPAPPGPKEPPPAPPQSGANSFVIAGEVFRSTNEEPFRQIEIPVPAATISRLTLSFRVVIPGGQGEGRRQVYALYCKSPKNGILAFALRAENGNWRVRAASAGPRPWQQATSRNVAPPDSGEIQVRQVWVPGANELSAGGPQVQFSAEPGAPLRPRGGLRLDLGYPPASVEGNPAEEFSIGWQWHDLEVSWS